MGKLTALAVAVIALLLVGLGLVVYRLSEFSVPEPASAGRAPATVWQPGLAPYQPYLSANVLVPQVMSEAPPLLGPVPAWLPEDPVERQKLLHGFRKQQVREQLELANRRNAERQGHAQTPASAPPAAPPR